MARRGPERLYVQVSESILNEVTRERELSPLRAVGNSFPTAVFALDRVGLGTTSDGITVANVIDWLLEEV